MNKIDFLRRLDQELDILDKEEKKEIIAFYEERFYSGTIYENKTEEEVIFELESPEVIARNVLEEYGVSPKYVKTKEERYSGINATKLVLLLLFDALVVSWLIPTLYSIVAAVFLSLVSYVGIIGLMVGPRTIADEFLFAFSTGGYILLFIFGLFILELAIYVTKKIIIYHMNVLKMKNREKITKKLHQISVEGWFKRHRLFHNIKSVLFVGAIIIMTYSGYHLFIKEGKLINEYIATELTTETYTVDLQTDIIALESWNIATNVENLWVKIVPISGTEVNVVHTYSDYNNYAVVVDETTNTIEVTNKVSSTTIIWGDIRDLFKLFGNDELVTIEVPENLLIGNINVEGVYGNVEIRDLEVSKLGVYTVNGKITLSGIKVSSNVTLNTANGEINVQDITGKYKIDVETTNGKIYLRNVEFVEYKLNTTNGTISLINLNIDDQDGVKLVAETTNGNVILDDVYVYDVTLDTTNGDIKYYNSDLTFIVVDLETNTTNGDISTNVD